MHKLNSIKKYIQNPKLVAGLILSLLVIFGFYWSEVRPILAKKSCYNSAAETAIKKKREEKASPYLYDRKNWKNYTTTTGGLFDIPTNGGLFNWGTSGHSKPAFEDNLKTGLEPAYIQENLDRIAKENDFYQDDYNGYYKLCLQSKGL